LARLAHIHHDELLGAARRVWTCLQAVLGIQRIQNLDVYERYDLQRQRMERRLLGQAAGASSSSDSGGAGRSAACSPPAGPPGG
jgi:hypothetical protein